MEALQDEFSRQYLYWYPADLAQLLIDYERDWAPAIEAFPSAKLEIHHGVDCYCLGHPNAAIFHFMRAVELCLRATATKLRVTLPNKKLLEWQEWKPVLEAMESQLKAAKQLTRGPKKEAELEFCSGILNNFEEFKNVFRARCTIGATISRQMARWPCATCGIS